MELPFKYRDTIMEHLGIRFETISKEKMVLTMPVDNRTRQYTGFLHGGASAVLAETAAGMGAWMNVDQEKKTVVGLEVNANHIRGKEKGLVTATATPLHNGRGTAVWEVKITDEAGKLICAARCTLAIVDI